jgi:hypothetical protein
MVLKTLSLLGMLICSCAFAKDRFATLIDSQQIVNNCRRDNVVVLVHGTKATHQEMLPLGDWLNSQGLCPIYFEYIENERLSKIARSLSAHLAKLIEERRLNKLIVVAHSMGGLISRKALTKDYFEHYNINIPIKFISLASPFAGFRQANNFNLFLYFFGRYFGAEKTYLEIGSKRPFILQAGKLHKSVHHYKIETIETDRKLKINDKIIDDDVLTLADQQHQEIDDQVIYKSQMEIGHNAIINNEGEISAQLELRLEEILAIP